MMSKKVLQGTLIAAAGWIGGVVLARLIFAHSEAMWAYGALVGWWLAAYLAAKFKVPAASALWLGVAGFAVFVFTALLGKDWFYHDVQSVGFGPMLFTALLQAVLLATPLLFDWAIGWLKGLTTQAQERA